MSNRVRSFLVAVLLLACLLTGTKGAHAGDPANIPVRPSFARSGAYVVYEPRPKLAGEKRACSFRHALCVHAQARQEKEALALLAAAENAWDVAVGVLDLPPPDPSPETGVLDVYLVAGEPYATRVALDTRDVVGGFDRASAFAMMGRGVASGCALDGAAARIVTRAILFRVAPATDDGSAIAETTYLSSLMVPCAPAPVAGLLLFQAHPELGLTDTMSPPVELVLPPREPLTTSAGDTYAAGASSFYAWTDRSFSASPGAMVRAMWALSPTLTPPGAARWNNEPDGFEVLRMSFREALGTKSTVDDLWLDFAVSRAFDARFPVRSEWSIDWPARARSLMSGAPGVAPTGAAFITVDCAARPKAARLRFEATWEEHERMLWTLVRVDAAGHEINRVGVPSRERGTDAQLTLVDLESTARVILVGVSAGDPLFPFDPDDYRQEPHGWLVSLSEE